MAADKAMLEEGEGEVAVDKAVVEEEEVAADEAMVEEGEEAGAAAREWVVVGKGEGATTNRRWQWPKNWLRVLWVMGRRILSSSSFCKKR